MRGMPSGGYFAWIELPEKCDVDAFALEAKKEKVATLQVPDPPQHSRSI